jgi:hypothetical protein
MSTSDWTAAGYTADEAAEWVAAGVVTPAEAFDWRLRGLDARDAAALMPIVAGELAGWAAAGCAVVWPARVPPGQRDFPDFVPGAIYAAARAVWARRGGSGELDHRLIVKELCRRHPETPAAAWKDSISTAAQRARLLRVGYVALRGRASR